ncbi:hypothetical protein VNO77_25350 [Canavalia gladiata]|uniref:Transmembrane protein n=1 Tax=Canavalia gladiata TaxID=3824 RepID=A0AAN9L7Y9_CANGL
MDQNQSEDQVLKSFNKKQFLKRSLKFIFSVFVFSVFVWYSSGFSVYPQSFNAYFSTCLFSMFTHSLESKYMFLICNGILAFIAKTSLTSSSDSHIDNLLQPSNLSETNAPLVSDMVVVPLSQDYVYVSLVVEEQVKWHEEEYNEGIKQVEEQEESTLCNKNEGRESETYMEEKAEEGETESGVEVAQDDEQAETIITTNEESVNTDELNRKFEEFIRKMKEEIRIEARSQLIAV